MMENYFFETSEKQESKKLYLLVIYDIIDNKRRLKFAKAMEGYGIRVQKSCFEAFLSEAMYRKLLQEIPRLIDKKADSVRVYRMIGSGEVTLFGSNVKTEDRRCDHYLEEIIDGKNDFVFTDWRNGSDCRKEYAGWVSSSYLQSLSAG